MSKTLFKCISVLLAMICLLTGCGSNNGAGQGLDISASDPADLNGLFNDASGAQRKFSLGSGWPGEEDVFQYTGEPLKAPFRLSGGTSSGEPLEVGLLLFVDGIAQPYSVALADGTELTESYMQVFQLENDEDHFFDMVFQPVTGKAGDTLSIQAITILKPSFCPSGTDRPSYGSYHSDNGPIPLQIAFTQDAPANNLKASNNYEITDIPKSVTDTQKYFGLDGADESNVLSVVPAEDETDSVIQAKNGSATFKVRLYGGVEANNNITIFVNHQPVQINGADYLAVRTAKGKMVEAIVTLDTSNFGPLNSVYAFALPTGSDSGLTDSLKSDSILLVN